MPPLISLPLSLLGWFYLFLILNFHYGELLGFLCWFPVLVPMCFPAPSCPCAVLSLRLLCSFLVPLCWFLVFLVPSYLLARYWHFPFYLYFRFYLLLHACCSLRCSLCFPCVCSLPWCSLPVLSLCLFPAALLPGSLPFCVGFRPLSPCLSPSLLACSCLVACSVLSLIVEFLILVQILSPS